MRKNKGSQKGNLHAPHSHRTLREIIPFYMIDCKTPLGKLIDFMVIIVNLAICAIFVMETYPLSEFSRSVLWNIDLIIVGFFILEYAARLYGAKDRLKHVINIYSVIDLIAIIPTISLIILPLFGISLDIGFIRIIRVFRVFRIFRFLRFTTDPDFFFGRLPFTC